MSHAVGQSMILATRLDGTILFVNEDLVQSIEETPDTVLTFDNGTHMMVQEKANDLIARIVAFRRALASSEPAQLVAELVSERIPGG